MTGPAPGRDCRGWPLVRAGGGLSADERRAADGHLALCRRCTAKLEAEKTLEQQLATAGSMTLGVAVAALAVRMGGKAVGAMPLAGASLAPVVALSTAAVLTVAAGGVIATVRQTQPAPQHSRVVQPVAPAPGQPVAAPTNTVPHATDATAPASSTPSTSGVVPAPSATFGPLLPPGQRSETSLPLPLPTNAVLPGTVLPTKLLPTKLLPTVSVPALPVVTAVPTGTSVTSVLPLPTLSPPPRLLPTLPTLR